MGIALYLGISLGRMPFVAVLCVCWLVESCEVGALFKAEDLVWRAIVIFTPAFGVIKL